jgi:hypothetical protein
MNTHRLRQLLIKPNAWPGWILVIWSLLGDIYWAIDFAGNMDFAWQHIYILRLADEFFTDHPFILHLLMTLAGVAWLFFIVRKYDDQSKDESPKDGPQRSSALQISKTNIVLFVLGLALFVWIIMTSLKLSALREDIDCFATPRSLTEEQIAGIADFLSKNESHEISVANAKDDAEAGNYSGDFRRAFEKGGWTVTAVSGVPTDANEGLSLNYTQTIESSQRKRDPKHPSPDVLISQALEQAHVQIYGNSGGNGIAITSNTLSLNVGHRRRDRYACADAIKKLKKEELQRRLDNL